MKPLRPKADQPVSQPGKRLLDLVLATAILPLALPVMAMVALLVRTSLGSPVWFRQARPGQGGRPITLFKFRTMVDRHDVKGQPLPDGQRLTPLGIFLRRTSLDELPELFNVFRGDLSLVGPRPLLLKYLPYFSETEQRRHAVKPGITGWAQIHGRNFLPWDRRLALDVWYVEHRSLSLDLYILAVTLWKVLRRDGVAANTDLVEPDLDDERRNSRPAGQPPAGSIPIDGKL